MKKVIVFLKDSKRAKDTFKNVEKILKDYGIFYRKVVNKRGIEEKLKPKGFDLMVVIGGDGTFLTASRIASKFNIPLIGINEGRFGFLTEVRKEEVGEVLPWKLSERCGNLKK